MRVGIAQVAAPRDAEAAARISTDAIEACADDGARLVVLPEYASGFDPRGVGPDDAQTLDGTFVTALRRAARSRGVDVLAGVTLEVEGQPQGGARARNAVVHVRADGTLGDTYTKVHLFDAFGQRESDRFVAGDPAAAPLVVDVDGLRLGVLTCFDLRFPESARRLVDAGAEAIVVPAAWAAGPGKIEQWTVLARARALENVAWLVAVGMAGRGVCGTSLVVDPVGTVVERLGLGPGHVVVDLDPARVTGARTRNPALDLRRYEVRPR
ncbi:nitrilase-related carbon-nitrogen hydrolase [Sanguibacter sp. HDW7]|uniref:nitrilase-related carbon-nitrogen hydrolase n=1 Tax=Sanguibacter sp. HDW7 TaxID=2714931 RepID=UPI00140BB6AA|nr:nitrilase-related carbon-nitrogen hydrolase [Sanguibacter sp. HDW7]QIK84160.1 hydrolase [Sanguibacter sp. HDW7]